MIYEYSIYIYLTICIILVVVWGLGDGGCIKHATYKFIYRKVDIHKANRDKLFKNVMLFVIRDLKLITFL